jgi:predicted nucleotidyltransferase
MSQDRLLEILLGKTRHSILALILGRADDSFYLRQIERITGAGLGAVQRELKLLTEAGIVRREVSGRQVYYRANKESVIYAQLKNLLTSSQEERTTSQIERKPEETRVRAKIKVPKEQLAEFSRRNHIRKLSLFGSVLREDFRPDSDIDVLVEFEEGKTPGFDIISVENELAQIFGRKIDLRTPQDLSQYFREQVVKEAEVQYDAT